MNPFRQPLLLAALAAARDAGDRQASDLLVAADVAEDLADAGLAAGLREVALAGCRPLFDATASGWRWLETNDPTIRLPGGGHHLRRPVFTALRGEVYGFKGFKHYSTYAQAIIALARLLSTITEPQR